MLLLDFGQLTASSQTVLGDGVYITSRPNLSLVWCPISVEGFDFEYSRSPCQLNGNNFFVSINSRSLGLQLSRFRPVLIYDMHGQTFHQPRSGLLGDFEDKSKIDFASGFWTYLPQLWSDFKKSKTGLQLRTSFINLWLPGHFGALKAYGRQRFWHFGSLR